MLPERHVSIPTRHVSMLRREAQARIGGAVDELVGIEDVRPGPTAEPSPSLQRIFA